MTFARYAKMHASNGYDEEVEGRSVPIYLRAMLSVTQPHAKHFSCRLILMKFENVVPNSHIIRNKVRSFVRSPPVRSLTRLDVAHTHTQQTCVIIQINWSLVGDQIIIRII